jgi:hypothetical protein
VDACRSYTDTLYLRMLATRPNKRYLLDKTPAYALVLDFIARIYPNAKFVVLTRHPLAVFSSFAESFFDSDYQAAHDYNPITERYVPAIAKFLREKKAPIHQVVYENLVADPDTVMRGVFEFLGIPHESEAIDYGKHEHEGKGLGDPIGVAKHSRPSTASLHKWAGEISGNPARLALCKQIVAKLDPADLVIWGHPLETFWKPLDDLAGRAVAPKPKKLDRYRLERKAIVALRARVQKSAGLRKLLTRARLAADVLLRE